MLVGYARVSTGDQNLDLQRDALTQHGCERIFTDVASGAKEQRDGLQEVRSFMRSGDVLVVWKLDRLGRSLKHLIEVVQALDAAGVGFRSLQENLDTTTSGGRLVFHVFGALAEFERDLIRERTQAGLASARARGRKGGRPRAMDEKKAAIARTLRQDPERTVKEICATLGISPATFYRYTGGSKDCSPAPSPRTPR